MALLVVIGICVVPCLYAWINVLANWDPYANTSEIPVAVVNEDKAVTLDDIGQICVGDMMIEALEENDAIDWQFMDSEKAIAGVRSGEYYAAIVIPEDFTQHLTGVLEGRTDKATLKYYVNEKVNPIAPKVTDTGASTIEKQIDSKFIAKVGEVVAEKLGDVTNKLLAGTSDFLGTGPKVLGEVHTTLIDVSDGLGDLATKLGNAQTALRDAVDRIEPLKGVGSRVSGKLSDLLTRLGETRADANGLMHDINAALGNGANSLASLSSRASYDIATLSGDIAAATSQVNAAIRTLESDLTDNQALTSKLNVALDSVGTIKTENEQEEQLRVGINNEISRELDVMVQLTSAQQAKIDELRGHLQRLQDAANEVSQLSRSVNDRVRAATDALTVAQTTTVTDTLLQVSSALDSFAQVGNQLSSAAQTVDPIIDQTVSLASQFADALSGTNGALEGTRSSLGELTDHLSSLNDELSAIRASETWSMLQNMLSTNPEGVQDFLSAPVELNEVRIFPVENYASGVAPFFSSLALWVGCIALVAIFKLEVDEEGVGRLRPWQAYFGRWLLFVLLGVLQAVICCTGDLIIGIQCAHPWAFYLSAIVASFAFVNIVFALSAAFKHLGKALAFTLIILQVPGSAGMYPIEMMPPFFQAIGPWLPFTYSINAMREAIGGFYGTYLGYNLGMLLLFVVPSLLIGVTARSHLVNVNALFDRRLRETDHLMVSEPIAIEGNHYRLATVVKAIHAPREYREELEARSAAFERAYPSLVRHGIEALFLLPLGLFVLMLVLDAPLPTIACFIVGVIGVYVFLILVEFFHDRNVHKKALTELSEEEGKEVLRETLRGEFLPQASLDAILERRAARERTGVIGKLVNGRLAAVTEFAGSAPDAAASDPAEEGAAAPTEPAAGEPSVDPAVDAETERAAEPAGEPGTEPAAETGETAQAAAAGEPAEAGDEPTETGKLIPLDDEWLAESRRWHPEDEGLPPEGVPQHEGDEAPRDDAPKGGDE